MPIYPLGGSPNRIDYRKKGTPVLTSLLEDLVSPTGFPTKLHSKASRRPPPPAEATTLLLNPLDVVKSQKQVIENPSDRFGVFLLFPMAGWPLAL